jgi:hypothetical protein
MKIEFYTECAQFTILPTIKITYDRFLNGYYELIFTWGSWGISIMI